MCDSKLQCCIFGAGIVGFITLCIHVGFYYHARLLNAELEGSKRTTCEIVRLSRWNCDRGDDETGIKFAAWAYVDICSDMFNKTIPWKGDIGLNDGCWPKNQLGKSGLPHNNFYIGKRWPCRVNCEKERWYTTNFNGYTKFVNIVFILGLAFLSTSILICFFCCYLELPPRKAAEPDPRLVRLVAFIQGDWINSDDLQISVKNRQVTFLSSGNHYTLDCWENNHDQISFRINDQTWKLCNLDQILSNQAYNEKSISWRCSNPYETIRWTRPQHEGLIVSAGPSREVRFNRMIASIQGDWRNSDGLLISVKNRQATFLPSGNCYKIDKIEFSSSIYQAAIRISNQIWTLYNFDVSTKDLESNPYFLKQIKWVCGGEVIEWNRREEPKESPPSYDNWSAPPVYDHVELYVNVPTSHPSAPPAYDLASVSTAC